MKKEYLIYVLLNKQNKYKNPKLNKIMTIKMIMKDFCIIKT